MNHRLRRLNHVLIPATKQGRDRLRFSTLGRIARPWFALYQATSEEGQLMLLVLIFVGAFGLDVGRSDVYRLWSVLFGLWFASVLSARFMKRHALRLEVSVPRRVEVGMEVQFTIRVSNDGDTAASLLRIYGPFLPWDGRWLGARPRINHLGAGACESRTHSARFVARGEHHLDPFRVHSVSTLGFGLGAKFESTGLSFVVLPRIVPVQSMALPEIFRYQPGGVALASRLGDSTEIVGVRPYRPGDRVRDVLHRRWARTGQPIVREMRQEAFVRVGIVLGPSGGSGREEDYEAALGLAAGILVHLAGTEVLVDLLVVGGVTHRMTLGRALGSLEQALDWIACAPAAEQLPTRRDDGGPLEALQASLAPHLDHISMLVFVGLDWSVDHEQWANALAYRGVLLRAYIVGEHAPQFPRSMALSRARLCSGEGVAL